MASQYLKESLLELNGSRLPDHGKGACTQAARGGCDFEASRLCRGAASVVLTSSSVILMEEAQPSLSTLGEISRHFCCDGSQKTPVSPLVSFSSINKDFPADAMRCPRSASSARCSPRTGISSQGVREPVVMSTTYWPDPQGNADGTPAHQRSALRRVRAEAQGKGPLGSSGGIESFIQDRVRSRSWEGPD